MIEAQEEAAKLSRANNEALDSSKENEEVKSNVNDELQKKRKMIALQIIKLMVNRNKVHKNIEKNIFYFTFSVSLK